MKRKWLCQAGREGKCFGPWYVCLAFGCPFRRIALTLALISLAFPVLAAAPVAAPNVVSDTTAYFDPIIMTLLQALGVVVATAATWALTRIAQNFGMKVSQQQTEAYDEALKKLVQFGSVRAMDLIERKGWNSVDVKNATIAAAVNGAVEKFPDALAGVGLSPDDPKFLLKVRDGLERVYPTAMAEVAASPATPPTTADLNRAEAAKAG